MQTICFCLKCTRVLSFLLLTAFFPGCTVDSSRVDTIESSDSSVVDPESIKVADSVSTDTISVLILPCSNGYEYAMHNFDFVPVLKAELKRVSKFDVLDFPYKKLMGVNYYGVYDKRYCQPIIDKLGMDYLLMTKFTGNAFPEKPGVNEVKWGYEIKILNVRTGEQRISIGADDLVSYDDLEEHIRTRVPTLRDDIAKLK